MFTFPFDAVTKTSDWSKIFSNPLDCARHLWGNITIELGSFDDACHWAKVDLDAHAQLLEWATNAEGLEPEDKARLFDVLVQGKPHKTEARNAYRNARLRQIAAILERDFGLKPTMSSGGRLAKTTSADILMQLDGLGRMDRLSSMEAILTKTQKNMSVLSE